MESPADRNKMADILGEISTYEHEHNRPMLSAIVVHKDNRLPGEGFFKLAADLGLYRGSGEIAELEFFAQEVDKIQKYWMDECIDAGNGIPSRTRDKVPTYTKYLSEKCHIE